MILRDLYKSSNSLIEGGNLSLGDPEKGEVVHRAEEIDLKVHNRSFMVKLLDKLLSDINNAFSAKYKTALWSKQLLQSRQFLGGSSLHFFDTSGITDQEFAAKKPKVGDIDTQCNKELEPQIEEFLNSIVNKQVGDTTFLGFSRGNEQLNGLFQFQDPPIKIQIDFEFGRYAPETNSPDEWYKFSHSSAWNDVQAGIKGVFHKYIYRALAKSGPTTKYIAKPEGRGKARAIAISGPVSDANFSFAVASVQGGGVRAKYKPYIDPATGQEKIIDGIPVMEPLTAADSEYIQDLGKQFELFFGRPPEGNDRQLQQSFLGTLELMNKYLDNQAKQIAFQEMLGIVFEPGAQMITAGDPARDRETKFAALDSMIEQLGLSALRPQAIQMAKAYEQDYQDVEAYKQANPGEKQPRAALKRQRAAAPAPLKEAEDGAQVKAQLRKGMPHLRDLKPVDLLDLIDEIHDGNGQFKLQNIPLNVKIDGFGGRFGKNADGKPFMGTSRTEPRYQAGFVDYHQKKGTTDPEILGRAKLFDQLFYEMMKAIKLVDSKLGPDFLINKQVTCEVLYIPFATETPEGRLKFVGIHYDKLPEGVQLALVPFRVVDATTGEDLPDAQAVVKELTSVGQAGSVMFIDNSLTQNEALDVTALVPPVENIEALKSMLADTSPGSLQRKRDVAASLAPVALALEKAIIEDPNIVGKDLLGKDYEGIVINSRLGPIKVTSQEQRDVITAKNAAKTTARTERPRGETKTAVVAIGSFVGHVGHEQLFDYTVKKAAAVGGDPYLFIGNAVGKDDPIPPDVKVQTWHKLYPEYAKNISATQAGGSLMQKIKHELINPLPGKPPRYDNVIIMVGEDQANMPIANALMKAVNKFQGYENVKVSLEVTPRGTGMSFSKLRNVLKDPNATEQQQFALWSQAFDVNKLGAEWIKHLMDITRKGMGIQQPQAPVPPAAPVAETRLFNALIRSGRVVEDSSDAISSMAKNLTSPGAPVAKLRAARDQARMKQGERSYGQPQSPKWTGVDVAEGSEIKIPTEDGITMQDIRLMAGEGPLTKKTILQAIAVIRKQRRPQGVAEGSGGNWYIRVNGKILNDTKFKPVIFSSEGEARSHAMKLADKKRIPLSQMKLTKSWMDAPEQGVAEERISAAVRMQRAADRQRAKSDASLRRTPSSIPKAEPKKDEKVSELNFFKSSTPAKKDEPAKHEPSSAEMRKYFQANQEKPLYRGNTDKDHAQKVYVRHAEENSKPLKTGPAAHFTPKDAHVKVGQFVGGESKKKGADGKACWDGYRYNGTANGKDKCVKVSEDIENIMAVLIEKIIVNEAIQNNNK